MTEKIYTLEDITDLIYAPGDPMEAGVSEDEALQIFKKLSREADKPVTVVNRWQWWDYIMSDQENNAAEEKPLSVVYSPNIVITSHLGFAPGYWVRTTPMIRFSDGCMVETRNSIYILCGTGSRKAVDPQLAYKLF